MAVKRWEEARQDAGQQHRAETRLWRLCQLIGALTTLLWLWVGALFIRMFLL